MQKLRIIVGFRFVESGNCVRNVFRNFGACLPIHTCGLEFFFFAMCADIMDVSPKVRPIFHLLLLFALVNIEILI